MPTTTTERSAHAATVRKWINTHSAQSVDTQASAFDRTMSELAQPVLPFREFIKLAWPHVEPGRKYVHGWHIDCLADHLTAATLGDLPNLILNLPPRHSKSIIVAVMWPAWVWTMVPESQWLFNSYAERLSIRDSVKCRRLIQSNWYQQNWGHVFQLAKDQATKTRFENDWFGYRIAASVGGTNTGDGGDYLVCDDVHNVIESESDQVRQGVIEWWTEAMTTRFNDPLRVRRVIVMQRVHEDDLAGHLLANNTGIQYHHVCLPARWEPRTFEIVPGVFTPQPHDSCSIAIDPRTIDGELLNPERMPESALAEIEATLEPYAAAGQMQQRPAPRVGAIFDVANFRPMPSDFAQQRLDFLCPTIQHHDTAFSTKANSKGDYNASITIVKLPDNRLCITHITNERVPLDNQARYIADTAISQRANVVRIELAAFKQQACAQLAQDVAALLDADGWPAQVQLVPAIVDKVTRAGLPASRMKQGQLYIDTTHPLYAALCHQLSMFDHGTHDDMVDALSGATEGALALRMATSPTLHAVEMVAA